MRFHHSTSIVDMMKRLDEERSEYRHFLDNLPVAAQEKLHSLLQAHIASIEPEGERIVKSVFHDHTSLHLDQLAEIVSEKVHQHQYGGDRENASDQLKNRIRAAISPKMVSPVNLECLAQNIDDDAWAIVKNKFVVREAQARDLPSDQLEAYLSRFDVKPDGKGERDHFFAALDPVSRAVNPELRDRLSVALKGLLQGARSAGDANRSQESRER